MLIDILKYNEVPKCCIQPNPASYKVCSEHWVTLNTFWIQPVHLYAHFITAEPLRHFGVLRAVSYLLWCQAVTSGIHYPKFRIVVVPSSLPSTSRRPELYNTDTVLLRRDFSLWLSPTVCSWIFKFQLVLHICAQCIAIGQVFLVRKSTQVQGKGNKERGSIIHVR